MKRSDKCASATGLRLLTLVGVSLSLVSSGFALTENNPYGPIVGRNVFALRPPTPVINTPTTPVVPPSSVELQGITTILGRPQVLLKIKSPAKPPAPASDQSFVLDVGQREGEVEVLGIDMIAGIVRLKNQGSDLALNMSDDAVKPTAGPALPGAIPPPGLNLPGAIPLPAPAAARSPGGDPVTTVGGSTGLPSRSLRSNIPSGGISRPGQAQPVRELTAEEGAALLEINRARNAGKGLPFPPSRVNLDQ